MMNFNMKTATRISIIGNLVSIIALSVLIYANHYSLPKMTRSSECDGIITYHYNCGFLRTPTSTWHGKISSYTTMTEDDGYYSNLNDDVASTSCRAIEWQDVKWMAHEVYGLSKERHRLSF